MRSQRHTWRLITPVPTSPAHGSMRTPSRACAAPQRATVTKLKGMQESKLLFSSFLSSSRRMPPPQKRNAPTKTAQAWLSPHSHGTSCSYSTHAAHFRPRCWHPYSPSRSPSLLRNGMFPCTREGGRFSTFMLSPHPPSRCSLPHSREHIPSTPLASARACAPEPASHSLSR